MLYKASPIKRHRRTRAVLDALDARIVDILAADHPQSVRHVFYRLTDPSLPEAVPKTDAGYQLIVRRCTLLRRSGELPYAWLTDSTRRGYFVSTFSSGGDLIQQFASLYRVNLWEDRRHLHRGLDRVPDPSRAVIEADCEALGVALYPCGGFASLSLAYQAAVNIRAEADGRPVRIVYIGDYDAAGVLIDRSVISELRGHLPDHDIQEARIAITPEQAARLPSKPRKAGDLRRPDIRETVEAEAMPAAPSCASCCAPRSRRTCPAGALAAAKVAEESERAGLYALGRLTEQHGTSAVLSTLAGDAQDDL